MRRFIFSRVTLLLAIVFPSLILAAQDSFQPDRPGFSTGTYTLPKGEVYLEVGYLLSYPPPPHPLDHFKVVSFPELTQIFWA